MSRRSDWRALEAFDPFWLEDPLHPDDIAGHRRLREATSILIAAGENTRTVHEVRQFLDAEAIDVIQADAVIAGGMLAQLEVRTLAAQHGVGFAPHTGGSAPGFMANIHTLACSPASLIMEFSQAANPLRERLLTQPLQMEDGHLVLPELPGLGVAVPPEILEEFPYDAEAGAVLKLEA